MGLARHKVRQESLLLLRKSLLRRLARVQRRRSVADRGLSLLRPDLNVTLDILEDVPIRLAKELRPLVEERPD